MKKILTIIVLLGLNFLLMFTLFIPSLWINILLGTILVASNLIIIYLGYQLIVDYSKKARIRSTVVISLVSIIVLLFTLFVNFIVFAFSGTFMKEYSIGNRTFYSYDTSFIMDRCMDVYVKINYLPIRTTKKMALSF